MTSPNPIDDLESLDPFFDNHAVKNLPIKGSQRRKMGNAGNMYDRAKTETNDRAKNETKPESISKDDYDFELDEL
jgi:hypothetical protein